MCSCLNTGRWSGWWTVIIALWIGWKHAHRAHQKLNKTSYEFGKCPFSLFWGGMGNDMVRKPVLQVVGKTKSHCVSTRTPFSMFTNGEWSAVECFHIQCRHEKFLAHELRWWIPRLSACCPYCRSISGRSRAIYPPNGKPDWQAALDITRQHKHTRSYANTLILHCDYLYRTFE